ncbi:hypothetical protein B0H13DRAFT_2395509 [Mycena leptocephala]|nr:hypothetical protein B0H13DRAFT_2395509 [Mycena leptocephala]
MALSSSSTTETTTYVLEKYSRAYTPKKASGGSEWQHFTNPVLRLILDSKLSPEKANSSMRMRIVWTMNGGTGATQDVVLEDLDLLAFSSLADNDKTESSPLKGVYRDTTFGLRYLHVPESTDSQKVGTVYRRFQVSFTTPSVALQLVNAIRDVCPCKTTEGSVKDRKKTVIPPRVPPAQDFVVPNVLPSPSLLLPAFTQLPSQHMPAMIKVPDAPIVPVPLPTSSPALLQVLSSQPEQFVGFSSSPAGGARVLGPDPHQHHTLSLYDHPMPQAGEIQPHLSKAPPSSLPDSSPPSSSADSVMMPPPPPPAQVTNTPASASASLSAETLSAALREATGLYDLPHAALERLVGDVVREDGFVRLLESVSNMWAMKAAAA